MLTLTYQSSNSAITPLFEKMLSASDASRVGRLVLPKKYAETYFPPISEPEGLPLRIQNAKGQEWTLQFRFWPNNNSRMYVLEGVTPCIQSMELQAGDIGNINLIIFTIMLNSQYLCIFSVIALTLIVSMASRSVNGGGVKLQGVQ
ncbi:hypothetical protein V2J09_004287 [Rumex salicifolius]